MVLPIRTVGPYLKRWGGGGTPQKPVKRAYEQQPARVQKWLDEEYPAIQMKAKEEAAEMYWGDETGLRNDCQRERGYAPRGKPPEAFRMKGRCIHIHFPWERLLHLQAHRMLYANRMELETQCRLFTLRET